MKKWGQSLAEQVQRNAVALISLTIAVLSLSYNTWRNETTEHQRNVRHAAFEMIDHLERFQSMVNAMVYGNPRRPELWVDAWGEAKALETLATLVPSPVPASSARLINSWTTQVAALRGDDAAAAQAADEQLTAEVDRTREAILEVISGLE